MEPVIIAALAAFVAALIALAVYHVAVAKPALRRIEAVLTAHDEMLGGGVRATDRLASLESTQAGLAKQAERADFRLRELEALSRTDVSRIGFVRYDAFEDTGSELSYAVALLNREGDGIVLSSIYSRTDTRTFAKAVERFVPLRSASAEELDAIEKARHSQN